MSYRAGFHIRGLVVMVAALCVLAVASAPVPAGTDPHAVYTLPYRVPSAQARTDLESRVLDLLNQERGELALPPLQPHAGLRSAARGHGLEMFTYGFLSHRSRDGRTLVERVTNQQIRVRMVAENIAYAQDVHTAHIALMDSDGHRKNILSPLFRLVGIAVFDGGARGVIVVQDFADAPYDLTARGRPVAR